MTVRLTMTPDTSDWAGADLRWAAGYGEGLRKDFADETEAHATGKWLADLGWTVTMEKMA